MKFIFRMEEDGYELRYWNEIDEEIGELLVESWDLHQIHNYLIDNHLHLSFSTLEKADKELENKGFIILSESSKPNKELVIFNE